MDRPSLTRAAACLRLAGVIRFDAPISSSGPQRPQFDTSFIASRNSASLVMGLRPSLRAASTNQPVRTTAGTAAAHIAITVRRGIVRYPPGSWRVEDLSAGQE